jgi:hypothetical protein
MLKAAITIVMVLLLHTKATFAVLAHQPKVVSNNPVYINAPEISKAYYDNATSFPKYYIINSPKDFELYLNLLVPSQTNPLGRFSAQVFQPSLQGNVHVATLSAQGSQWFLWSDSSTNDSYYRGPELRQKLPAGFYEIEVTGNQNAGKYVLAVGEKEEFTIKKLVETAFMLPDLKKNFFGDKPWNYLGNIFGLSNLFFILLTSLSTSLMAKFLFKKFSRKKRAKLRPKEIFVEKSQVLIGLGVFLLSIGIYAWLPWVIFAAGVCFFEAIPQISVLK